MRALKTKAGNQVKNDEVLAHSVLGRARYGIAVLALGIITACGGGTTGTSSSDSLRFSGFAEGADGVRASGISMSISSATTSEKLVDSGTNDTGDFSMELPADDGAFMIDVEGVGTTQITRQQRGVGTMASKLTITSAGALIAEDVFEAQRIATVLCKSLTPSGSVIAVPGAVGNAPCEAVFSVASKSLPLTSFRGDLVASCAGSTETITSAQASAQGVITLDLNQPVARGCSDIKVSISSSRAPELQSEFPVL